MIPRRVLVRVDASSTIGDGHLARCSTLAQVFLGRAFAVDFVCATLSTTHARRLESAGVRVHSIDAIPGSTEDASSLIQYASSIRAELAVIDGYDFGESYFSSLRATNLVTCCVDDLGTRHVDCHAILNQNAFASELNYGASADCELMLGPKYALIRPEFLEARQHRRPQPPMAARVLVTMGGADPTGETLKAVHALDLVELPLEVRIVVGASNPNAVAVNDALRTVRRHRAEILVDVRDMATQMAWCDVAITAGGSTCLELSCVGAPALVIAVAENQRPVMNSLGAARMMHAVGWHEDVSTQSIAVALDALLRDAGRRTDMACRQRATVDGQGAHRVADLLMSKLEGIS